MPTATIDYTGIIGFHPSRDDTGAITSLLVLAPNAWAHPHHRHECWLRVLSHPPTVGGNVTPRTKKCSDDSERYLLDEVMTVNGARDSSLIPAGFQQMLVPLERSDPDQNARRLDRQLKSKQKHPRVSLWSELVTGTFTAIQPSPCLWKFSHWGAEEEPIPLAQVVRQVVELSGSDLELRFDRAGNQFYTLTLSPEDGPIHVEIGNTPDACDTVGSPTSSDHHVKLFNLLAKSQKSIKDLKHLECYLEFVAVDGANCPPGWWDNSS